MNAIIAALCTETYEYQDKEPDISTFLLESMDQAIRYASCLALGRDQIYDETDQDGTWNLAWNDKTTGTIVGLKVNPNYELAPWSTDVHYDARGH